MQRAFLLVRQKLAVSFCQIFEASVAFQHINIHQYGFNLLKVGYWQQWMIFLYPLCLTPLINSIPVPLCDHKKAGYM